MRIGTSSLTLDLRFSPRPIILLAVVLVLGMPPLVHADVVTDWNTIATTVGPLALPAILPQSRVYAMTQAAVHNALNAIDRRYQPYAFTPIAASNASPEAAVATAAHDVSALMEYRRKTVEEASVAVIDKIGKLGGTGGMIVIDKNGIIQHIKEDNEAIDPASAQDACNILTHKKAATP